MRQIMHKGLFLGTTILFGSVLTYAQAGWYPENYNTDRALMAVSFPTSEVGFAAGENFILKTENGGGDWGEVPWSRDRWNYDIDFVDEMIGTVVGYYTVGAGGWPVIFSTVDGGATWWQGVPAGVCHYCYNTGVSFIDPWTGFVAGAELYATTDGGGNWAVADSNGAVDVEFIDHSTVVTVGDAIRRTTDGGTTWNIQYALSGGHYLGGVSFFGPDTGVVVGTGGTILSTTDGGINWYSGSSGTTRDLNAVVLVDRSRGTAVGDSGTILLTTDGGLTWGRQMSGTEEELHDVFFVSRESGIVVGDHGTILHTSDGGGPVSVSEQSELHVIYRLNQNYPNPFNPSTTISFSIQQSSFINLTVYDLLGRVVATLVNEKRPAGTYTEQWDAAGLPSGVYLYRLRARHTDGGQAGSYVDTKKLVLVR